MSILATNGRERLWFGTVDRMGWLPTPNRGASVNPEGWGAGGSLLSGGAYQLNSFPSALNYSFEWPESSSQEVAQIMKSYFDGSYGRGLIYFVDPLCYTTNILPAMWADPSMAIGSEAETLVPGVTPGSTPTTSFEVNGLPVRSAVYSITGGATAGTPTFFPRVTNHFTNTRFVGNGTWSEIRRNAIANPGFELGTIAGFSSNGGGSGVTVTATTEETHSGLYSGKVVSEGLGANRGINQTLSVPMVPPAGVVTGSVWVKFPEGFEFALDLQERNPAGGYLNSRNQTFTGTGDWQRVSNTRTDIASTNRVTLAVFVPTAVPVTFYVDDYLVEFTDKVLDFFDGSAPFGSVDPDCRGRWEGTVGASASILEIENVGGFNPVRCVAGVSTWKGKPAMRLVANMPYLSVTDTYSYVYFNIPTNLRAGGTFRGTRHLTEPLSGPTSTGYRGARAGNPYQGAVGLPNEAGSVSADFAYSNLLSLYRVEIGHGGAAGSGDVWWTGLGLMEEGYSGGPFDGSSGTVEVDGQTLETRWNGAVDNSTSSAGVFTFTTPPMLDESNSVFVPIPDGYALHLGAFYSSSSASGGVYVSRVARGGTIAQPVDRLTPLATSGTQLFSHIIQKQPGDIGVRVWVGKISAPVVTLVLSGIHARLAPVGKPVKGVKNWVGGQGHSGAKFSGPPTKTNFSGVNGGQVGFAASFREIGSWVMG